jgi:hypothetical protein
LSSRSSVAVLEKENLYTYKEASIIMIANSLFLNPTIHAGLKFSKSILENDAWWGGFRRFYSFDCHVNRNSFS